MAQWSEQALERLSGAGYRRGGARQAVIELLDEQPCALSALDIEDQLRARDGRRVGRASIYRVVDELVTLGLLTRVEVGDGVARYEPQRPAITITSCATAAAASSRSRTTRSSARSTTSPNASSFDVSDHDVTLHGDCEACRSRLGNSTPGALSLGPR